MKIQLPKKCIVVICGPSCSGKTTLAKRIEKECPWSSIQRISVDDSADAFKKAHPEEALKLQSLIAAHRPLSECKEFALAQAEIYYTALTSRDIVLFEGIYIEQKTLISQIAATSTLRSKETPYIILILNPEYELHREFFCKRFGRTSGCLMNPLDWPVICQERACFKETIKKTDSILRSLMVKAYEINDPRAVEIEFVT